MFVLLKSKLGKVAFICSLILFCSGIQTAQAGNFSDSSYYLLTSNSYYDSAVHSGISALYLSSLNADPSNSTYNAYYNMYYAQYYAYYAQYYAYYGYISNPIITNYYAYLYAYYDYTYKNYAFLYLYYAYLGYDYTEAINTYSYYGDYYNGYAAYYSGLSSNGGSN